MIYIGEWFFFIYFISLSPGMKAFDSVAFNLTQEMKQLTILVAQANNHSDSMAGGISEDCANPLHLPTVKHTNFQHHLCWSWEVINQEDYVMHLNISSRPMSHNIKSLDMVIKLWIKGIAICMPTGFDSFSDVDQEWLANNFYGHISLSLA